MMCLESWPCAQRCSVLGIVARSPSPLIVSARASPPVPQLRHLSEQRTYSASQSVIVPTQPSPHRHSRRGRPRFQLAAARGCKRGTVGVSVVERADPTSSHGHLAVMPSSQPPAVQSGRTDDGGESIQRANRPDTESSALRLRTTSRWLTTMSRAPASLATNLLPGPQSSPTHSRPHARS